MSQRSVDLLALALGDGCNALGEAVRKSHRTPLEATGRFDVEVPWGCVGDWVCGWCRLPRCGVGVMVRLTCEAEGRGVRWNRTFGDLELESTLEATSGGLAETTGDVCFHYELVVNDGALHYRQVGFSRRGRNHPLWLSPRVVAVVSPAGEGWHVDVTVRLPVLGTICRYSGRMETV